MNFPTLSRRQVSVLTKFIDHKISHTSEGGYDHRRPRYRKNKRSFEVTYDLLPTADKDLLINFYDSVGTYKGFNWTHQDGTVFFVYFNEPVEYSQVVTGWFAFESLKLIEV